MIRFIYDSPYLFRVNGDVKFVGLRYKKYTRIKATRYYHE